MATVKGKSNDANATAKGKTSIVGDGKSKLDGKNGGAANAAGPIAGSPASEPVAIGNDGNAGKSLEGEQLDNGTGAALNPEPAAPSQPKPGKRGRHPGTCTCPTCTARRAAGPSEPKTKSGLALNNQNWAKNLYGFHQMVGRMVPIPDITRIEPGSTIGPNSPMLAYITMDEAQRLSDAAYAVAVEYDLAKYFSGRAPVLLTLAVTAGFIYIPKIQAMTLLIKMQKAAQKTNQPPTAASAFEQPPANDGINGGAYKYA